MTLFKSQVETNLVEVTRIDPRIQLDLRYATPHNFLGCVLYSQAVCYLHLAVAQALSKVQDEVESLGLFLKVYDGYRPLFVQQQMWNYLPDERYVANPAKNKGRHTRGTAVDVTLTNAQGQELEMPTEFDDFSERAQSDSLDISLQALNHRALLKKVMEKQGFSQFHFEWWHFDFNGWENEAVYPPLNLAFEEIQASV